MVVCCSDPLALLIISSWQILPLAVLEVLIADLAGLEVMFHRKADSRVLGFFFLLIIVKFSLTQKRENLLPE